MSMFFAAQAYHYVATFAARILVSEGVHADHAAARNALGDQFHVSHVAVMEETRNRADAAGLSSVKAGEPETKKRMDGILEEVLRESLVESGHLPAIPSPR